MNVDRRRLGSPAGRIRVLAMGLALLAAGSAVLGWGSRHMTVNLAAQPAADDSALLKAVPQPQILPIPRGKQQGSFSLPNGEAKAQARSLLAELPLIFEPNQGQANLDPADARAKFVSRGAGYSLFLGKDGAILSLVSRQPAKAEGAQQVPDNRRKAARVESLQMKIAGANPKANVSGSDRLPGMSNYLLGNDPAKWRPGVPQFARVRYEDIYPGINLIFYGNQGRLEYDFQVAPGADPGQAEFEFNGAKQLAVKDGALVIQAEDGSVRLEAPRVYQEIAGKQQAVDGRFVLRGANRVGFAIGSYDHSRELVIDPILNFSTYFGGVLDELNSSIAVDGALNIYLAGSTNSPSLATAGTLQTVLNGTRNVYIAKITPPLGSTPAALLYVTYLGGNGSDSPAGIQVDGSGDPFVAGTTSSTNFPTTSLTAYQNGPEPGSPGPHVFVTELNSSATGLQYSSYLSGNGSDVASGMAIDSGGFIYITGTTTSSDTASTKVQFPASTIPQALPFQNASRASVQFFVTKVNPRSHVAGSIAYSTYFGGGSFNTPTPVAVGGGIAVDTQGNVYFAGTTNFIYSGCSGCSSTDFPILNPYQPCLDQPPPTTITTPPTCSATTNTTLSDAFVAKLNLNPNAAQGEQLIWSTYLGGSGTDLGAGVALDPGAANVYLVGTTNSTDIGSSVVIANSSSAYQRCLDTPVNPAAGTQCPTPNPVANDAFVARLSNPATTTPTTQANVTLNYFSYLGGTHDEAGLAIAVDNASGALVTGWTQSPDFPVRVASPIQSALNGSQDAFVARLNTATTVGQTNGSWASYFGGNNLDEGTSITLDVNQGIYFAGDTTSTSLFPLALPLEAANNGGSDAFVTQLGTALSLSVNGVLTLGTNQTYISAGNQATFTYTITNTGPDLANNITLTDNLNSSVTGVPLTFVSASTSAGTCGGASASGIVSCSLPSLQSGSTATVTIVVTPTPNSSGNQASFNGGTVLVSGPGNIVAAHTSVPAQMSDFSLQVSPSNASVAAAGLTATYQVSLQPAPVYASSISLACTGLPQGASCNFTTNPVNLQGPGASTLNIPTTARPVVTPAASLMTRHFYALWFLVPGLALLGVGAGSDRRWRLAGIFFLCATFGMLLLLPACSHSTTQAPVSGTPPGIYTITVTATSGSDTKSQTITLSVP